MEMTRRWGLECCKRFFGFTATDEAYVAGDDGATRLLARWQAEGEAYYQQPLHLLRQEWWHATTDQYAHPGFWWACAPGSRIVEYGAGVGAVSLPGIMAGLPITLVDLPGCTLDYLRWKFARCENVQVRTTQEWEADQTLWDGLVCVDVLEHVPAPLSLQAQLWERLLPRGQALLHLDPAFPHEGHLEASAGAYAEWLLWLSEETEVLEIERYAWVRKPASNNRQ